MGQGRQKAAACLLEGTRLLLLYRQLIAAGRSGPAGEVKRRLYQLGLSGPGERVHRTDEKALRLHLCGPQRRRHRHAGTLQEGFLARKGPGPSPLPTGTKKPRRAALQPHSGGKDDELLFTCGRGSESGMPLPCSCGCRQSGRPRRSWSSCRYPSRLPSCQGAPCRQHSESHSESQIQ